MDVDQIYIVDELRQKVKILAGRLEEQKLETKRLLSENSELSDRLKEQGGIVEELKQQNNTLKLSRAFVAENGNSSKEAKVQISRIVREIDKCIALLNR